MTSRKLASAAAAASLAGIAVLGMSAPASAQTPPCYPAPCSAAITDTTVVVGQSVTVTAPAGTFDAGSTVTVTVSGTDISDTVTAAADGSASFTFTLPAGAEAGPQVVTFSGTADGAATSAQVPFTVVAGAAVAPVTSDGSLPRTGSDSIVPLTIAGVALVGIGASIVVAARRRQDASLPAGLA